MGAQEWDRHWVRNDWDPSLPKHAKDQSDYISSDSNPWCPEVRLVPERSGFLRMERSMSAAIWGHPRSRKMNKVSDKRYALAPTGREKYKARNWGKWQVREEKIKWGSDSVMLEKGVIGWVLTAYSFQVKQDYWPNIYIIFYPFTYLRSPN